MKIAITGDFHFGFNEDALEQARRALIDAKGKADFVIAAGDLFDFRVPSQEVVHDAVRVFGETRDYGDAAVTVVDGGREKPGSSNVIAIYGTHERRTKGLVNIIEILHAAGLLVNCHARKVFVEKDGERVCVQGMGGVPEELAGRALKLMEYKPEKGCFNVFIFHQSLSEIIPQDKDCISMADLPNGFDLYVNGHIHWRHDLNEAGKRLLIPGSTVVTQMKKNEAQPKGYYLFDSKTGNAEFVTIPTRPFHHQEISFNNAGLAEVEDKTRKALEAIAESHGGQVPLVKLKLTGTLAPGLSNANLDLSALERNYSESMILSIDRQIGAKDLKEKLEAVRRMRDEKKNAAEFGITLLRERIAEKNIPESQLPPGAIEPLFTALSQNDTEKALELLEPKED